MAALPTPPSRSPLRDLYFMGDPALWATWPFLPLVRRQPDGGTLYGVLFDARAVCQQTGYLCTVFLTNLFLVPRQLDQLFALPKEVFDTFDELIAAGWRVD